MRQRVRHIGGLLVFFWGGVQAIASWRSLLTRKGT